MGKNTFQWCGEGNVYGRSSWTYSVVDEEAGNGAEVNPMHSNCIEKL